MADSQQRGSHHTGDDDVVLLYDFVNAFYFTASLQGKVAYLLMSIRAVNPKVFTSILYFDPYTLFFRNMIYGMTVHLFSRPSMYMLLPTTRLSFSILGSMMFNYSSMLVYQWAVSKFNDRPIFLTLFGFFLGRMMMGTLLAYLYHVDSRNVFAFRFVRRDSNFESMYMHF